VPYVRLTDVSKSYRLGPRRVDALRGVDLEIAEPGFYGIMGPSGSGKSTLMHLLAALDRPDSGRIEIDGRRIDDLSESELTRFRRLHLGIVFQQFNLIPTLTARENVALPGLLDGAPAAARHARADELLERLELGDRTGHRPDALSGGEQQRVALARALFFEPALLLADEPTGNLDTRASEAIWRRLRRLSDEGEMMVLMVTHEPAAAVHCQHVYLLRDGRVQDSFDVDGLDAADLATRAQHAGG
jgi:putative ABC transport system ATP-binding protein